VGEEVTFVDPDGIIRGTVAVREVADPFTGYDPGYPPEEGMRDVLLTVTFQAALDQQFDAQPSVVKLQASDGTLYTPVYIPRPADSMIPDLQAQLMAPDNRVSGIIAYTVPKDATIERVVYQPAYDRLLSLLELAPEAAPAPGGTVSYTDATGASASISTAVADPYTEFDPTYPPEPGTRFVMLQPVFENVGELPYWEDPYDLAVRDSSGFLYTPSTIYRAPGFAVPMLESQTTSPGDRVSGLVGFIVPAEAQLTEVLYYPESSRIVTLADLGGGGAAPAESAASAAPPEDAPTSEASAAPAASPTPDPSAGTGL
jgi:hypothetical protein